MSNDENEIEKLNEIVDIIEKLLEKLKKTRIKNTNIRSNAYQLCQLN